MWEQWTQRLRDKTIIYVCFFIVICSVVYFTSHVICCTPATATSLQQDNMLVGSLMITTQAVCGGMLSRSVSVTK